MKDYMIYLVVLNFFASVGLLVMLVWMWAVKNAVEEEMAAAYNDVDRLRNDLERCGIDYRKIVEAARLCRLRYPDADPDSYVITALAILFRVQGDEYLARATEIDVTDLYEQLSARDLRAIAAGMLVRDLEENDV